jgi:hypothetical protein
MNADRLHNVTGAVTNALDSPTGHLRGTRLCEAASRSGDERRKQHCGHEQQRTREHVAGDEKDDCENEGRDGEREERERWCDAEVAGSYGDLVDRHLPCFVRRDLLDRGDVVRRSR